MFLRISTLIFLTAALLLFPFTLFAGTVPAGVPDRSLWFSKDPFFVGDTITIYTLLYNSSDYRFTGTLSLFDATTTIGKKDFVLNGSGASLVVSFPWTVTSGNHAFSGIITTKEFLTSGGEKVGDAMTTMQTGEVKRFADIDTDHDGLGNMTDTDDDNDGLTDVEEKKLRTNPLEKDTDQDGSGDKEDKEPLIKNIIEPTTPATPGALPTSLAKDITDRVPDPVLDKALPVIGKVEGYRSEAYADTQASVTNMIHTIAERMATGTVSSEVAGASTTRASLASLTGWQIFREGAMSQDVIHSPFEYVKLFALLIWQVILGNVYVFYALLLFVIYEVCRYLLALFT